MTRPQQLHRAAATVTVEVGNATTHEAARVPTLHGVAARPPQSRSCREGRGAEAVWLSANLRAHVCVSVCVYGVLPSALWGLCCRDLKGLHFVRVTSDREVPKASPSAELGSRDPPSPHTHTHGRPLPSACVPSYTRNNCPRAARTAATLQRKGSLTETICAR